MTNPQNGNRGRKSVTPHGACATFEASNPFICKRLQVPEIDASRAGGHSLSMPDALIAARFGACDRLRQSSNSLYPGREIFQRLLHSEIITQEKLEDGRNSQVFKLTCRDGRDFVGKIYFRDNDDLRDRLGVEFNGLSYLRGQGVKMVPMPIAIDQEAGCAVYEFIPGCGLKKSDIGIAAIDQAVDFLKQLKEISRREASLALPSASEACFSVRDIMDSLDLRIQRFETIDRQTWFYRRLNSFLANDFKKAYDRWLTWTVEFLKHNNLEIDAPIEQRNRTLSPSDFGFHNAVLDLRGELVFLDFEYFGWDDPAKMIADFLLHPGMSLSDELKYRFATNIFINFDDIDCIRKRVEAVYPLFALKWCLILLNEFIPREMRRRKFAGFPDGCEGYRIKCEDQLNKAKQMLKKVDGEYKRFPYNQ